MVTHGFFRESGTKYILEQSDDRIIIDLPGCTPRRVEVKIGGDNDVCLADLSSPNEQITIYAKPI